MSLPTRTRRAAVVAAAALAATLAVTALTASAPRNGDPAAAPTRSAAPAAEQVVVSDAVCAAEEKQVAPGVCADTTAAPVDPREGYEVHGLPAAAAGTAAAYKWGAPTLTGAVNVPCTKPGNTGNRIQGVYVYFTGQKSRYSTTRPIIQKALLQANGIIYQSARQTGNSRHLRLVTGTDCKPYIQSVQLPSTAAATFSATAKALRAKGFTRMDRKYMVFAESRKLCGVAEVFYDDQPGVANRNNRGNMIGRADLGCWNGQTAAHEITHMLGAVQKSAARNDGGLHCRDERDLMCYKDAGPKPVYTSSACRSTILDERLDCGKNDYFHTRPASGSYLAKKWNTARSSYLWYGGAPYVYAPGAVRSLNVVAYNATTMKITFAGPLVDATHGPATKYYIYRDSTKISTQTSGTFYDKAALPGKSTYWVVAANGTGTSSRVGKTVTRPELKPAAPVDLKAIPTTSGIRVSWTYPTRTATAGAATGVKVIKNGTTIGNWGTAVTAFTDGNPKEGLNTYQVILSNAAGTGPTGTTTATYVPPAEPGQVTNLKASPTSTTVTLSWTAPTVTSSTGAATGYMLFRNDDYLGMAWSPSYVDRAPLTGTSVYKVVATNGGGSSDYSTAATVTVKR